MKKARKITDAEYHKLEKIADSGPMTTDASFTDQDRKLISDWMIKRCAERTRRAMLKH